MLGSHLRVCLSDEAIAPKYICSNAWQLHRLSKPQCGGGMGLQL